MTSHQPEPAAPPGSTLTLYLSLCPPAVTNFNNGLEASSDSDDEDKLHIVEEDSLQEPEAAAAAAAAATGDGTTLQDSRTATAVLPHNGFNGGRRPIWTFALQLQPFLKPSNLKMTVCVSDEPSKQQLCAATMNRLSLILPL